MTFNYPKVYPIICVYGGGVGLRILESVELFYLKIIGKSSRSNIGLFALVASIFNKLRVCYIFLITYLQMKWTHFECQSPPWTYTVSFNFKKWLTKLCHYKKSFFEILFSYVGEIFFLRIWFQKVTKNIR